MLHVIGRKLRLLRNTYRMSCLKSHWMGGAKLRQLGGGAHCPVRDITCLNFNFSLAYLFKSSLL